MRRYREALFIALTVFIFVLVSTPSLLGAIGSLPPKDVRQIAKVYLNSTFNTYDTRYWTASPEAVAAIVWDYRGLDTLYETMVLYAAVVGCLALYREALGKKDVSKGEGLSLIVKRATAITMVGIAVVGASTVLHGMVTPGGGFQGGAIMAVAPVIAIVVFSRVLIDESKLTYIKALILRNLAIIGIVLVTLIPVAIALNEAYVFQNQAKTLASTRNKSFSYPSQIFDVPMGGAIWFLNIFEGLAVFAAFYLAFKVILYSEDTARDVIVGDDRGY